MNNEYAFHICLEYMHTCIAYFYSGAKLKLRSKKNKLGVKLVMDSPSSIRV